MPSLPRGHAKVYARAVLLVLHNPLCVRQPELAGHRDKGRHLHDHRAGLQLAAMAIPTDEAPGGHSHATGTSPVAYNSIRAKHIP